MPSEIEKRAANLAALPLAAALLVIAIPLLQIDGSEAVFTFKYWGGGEDFNRMEVIRNFALIVGGFLGLWLAWRRITLMDAQTAIALEASSQTEKEHVAERFERAVELLNAEELHFKRYGALRMMKIADEYPAEYRVDAIHLICTTVREIADKTNIEEGRTNLVHSIVTEMVTFVFKAGQAIYDIAGEKPPIDLSGTFVRDVDVEDVTIFSDAIYGCHFAGGRYSRCTFIGGFSKFTTFFETEFRDCNLRRTRFLGATFFSCEFVRCAVTETTWVGCDFTSSVFNVLVMPEKRRAIFVHCDLSYTKFVFSVDGEKVQRLGLSADVRDKRNFVPKDFLNCRITEVHAEPRGFDCNQPPLIISKERRAGSESSFNLVFSEEERVVVDDDVTQAE
ncbi:MAG: pentapeptide repeat-containing protein [Rhodobacteraceae bacterium]|nr:pentapeptide repeat-containing protein [Paracoccaceae bacterium]